MKYFNFFSVVLLVVISSCTKDKDPEIPTDNGVITSYFPLKTNNYWTYETTNTSLDPIDPIHIGRDSLYVGNDSIINVITYKKMKTKNLPTGFFCGALRNNGLREDGQLIKITGGVSVNLGESLPIDFSVNDFVLFKENATIAEEFGKTSGTFIKTISTLPDYPLTINYVLTAKEDGTLPTFKSANGVDYVDVKRVKLVLNVKISSEINKLPLIIINVLNPEYQDVLVSYQYYAKNYGLIQSDTTIEYHLNASLPLGTIPAEGKLTTNEYLLTKQIN